MTGKMVATLLGVAAVAGGIGGGAGWMLGRSPEKPAPFNVIHMADDHATLAELCRERGAQVQVAVTAIEFDGQESPVTDQTLAQIAAHHLNSTEPIRMLVLRNAQITDEGLAQLKECPSFDALESINLTNCTGITDQGLQYLKRPALETLNVTGCDQITNAALNSLLQAFRWEFYDRKKLKILGRSGLVEPKSKQTKIGGS